MAKLPAADWHQRPSLHKLIDALGGPENCRYVGGAVRDTLIGRMVSDVDIATRWPPQTVIEQLAAAAIRTVPTGLAHGTITALSDDGPVEITTLRRDVSTDGRRATVAFSQDWREDAARRDFTINALSADPLTLEIYDYFGGIDDLAALRIRFIGSAAARIAEDHLRVMRYFRFLARFGRQEVDEEAYHACCQAAAQLPQLSRERIADELLKLLATDDPAFAVMKMIEAEILTHIIGAIDPEALAQLSRLIARERQYDIAPSPLRRLAALLPKDHEQAAAIARGLKLSKKQQRDVRQRIVAAADEAGAKMLESANIRMLAYHTNSAAARDQVLLYARDAQLAEALARLENWQPPVLPLTGGDLIALGMKPGPPVAKMLSRLEQAWIEQGFPDEAQTRALAKSLVDE